MNLIAVFSLASGIITFIIGLLVFIRNPRVKLNILFFITCILVCILSLVSFFLKISKFYDTALIWVKINSVWPFLLATFLHFTLIFCEKKRLLKKIITYLILYIPPSLIFIIEFTTFFGTGPPIRNRWGWTYSIPKLNIIYVLIIIWTIINTVLFLFLYLKFYFSISDKKKKIQTRFVLIGLLFPALYFIFIENILTLFQIKLPELSVSTILVADLFVAFAIVKYQLFKITPANAAKDILATISDSLVLTDTEYKIKVINNAVLTLLNYEEKDLIDKKIDVIFYNNQYSKIINILKKKSITDMETSLISKNNNKITVSLSVSMLLDKHKISKGYIFLARDITKRKEIERHMRELNNALLDSAYQIGVAKTATGVLHNLKSILTGMSLSVDSLSENISRIDDESYHEELRDIENGISIMTDIIETQQRHAKITKAEEKVNIKDIIDDALRIQENIIVENDIKIVRNYIGCPDLAISKAKLIQIFINLIKNACESIVLSKNKKKILNIHSYYENEKIIIIFKDTGTGIPKRKLKKIFDFGYTTKKNGHGFGLHTCHRFLTDIEGKIYAESEGKNKGASFIIELPK